MKLTTRELVEIKFAVMEALGLDESMLKLNELMRSHSTTNVNMVKVLKIAQIELEKERDKSWLYVLDICNRYLNPPYRELGESAIAELSYIGEHSARVIDLPLQDRIEYAKKLVLEC